MALIDSDLVLDCDSLFDKVYLVILLFVKKRLSWVISKGRCIFLRQWSSIGCGGVSSAVVRR